MQEQEQAEAFGRAAGHDVGKTSGQPTGQATAVVAGSPVGQRMYMMSPATSPGSPASPGIGQALGAPVWRRGRSIFTASHGPHTQAHGSNHQPPPQLFRVSPQTHQLQSIQGLPQRLPQGYHNLQGLQVMRGVRLGPYRPYYPVQSHGLYPTEYSGLYASQGSDYLSNIPDSRPQTDDSLYPCSAQPQVYPPYSQAGWSLNPTQSQHGLPYGPGNEKGEVPAQISSQPSSSADMRLKYMGAETRFSDSRPHNLHTQDVQFGSRQMMGAASDQQGLDISEIEVRTSPESQEGSVTFNSIEEALDSIDSPAPLQIPDLPDRSFVQMAAVPCPRLCLGDEKHEEVIKAAKSLFSKRTRTLLHWLYPQTSKTKLKATVSAAWDTLCETEKQFYLSQVLGRFGLQASSLMINPQLDGIKGLPMQLPSHLTSQAVHAAPKMSTSASSIGETQQAVDQLFASCADSDTWTSYSSPSPVPQAIPQAVPQVGRSKTRPGCRKRPASRGPPRLGALPNDQLDEEVTILKRMREAKLEAELEDDAELSSELEKFRLLAQDAHGIQDGDRVDDFWRRTPDPEDIFTQLDF